MASYYNEIDPFAVDWLRELIKAGHIAPGEVDTRSIEDVVPTDLAGFTQCHFFAGVAVWSYALRLAGWPDDRPVWTGSCPCQPFSKAGKGDGFADERHLWPAFFHLIDQCRPLTVFGEQVASKNGLAWLDLVQADLEGAGYSCGAVDSCAAGFGAPHIRQRLYWVADAGMQQSKQFAGKGASPGEEESGWAFGKFAGCCDPMRLADSNDRGCMGRTGGGEEYPTKHGVASQRCASCGLDNHVSNGRSPGRHHNGEDDWQQPCATLHAGGLADAEMRGQSGGIRECVQTERPAGETGGCGASGGLVHAPCFHSEGCSEVRRLGGPESSLNRKTQKGDGETNRVASAILRGKPGPVNGYWGTADWLLCRDGRWRPVEPGTFPLAHGATNRVGRLRGYGNALNAIQAKEFIKCFMDWCESARELSGIPALPLLASDSEGGQ